MPTGGWGKSRSCSENRNEGEEAYRPSRGPSGEAVGRISGRSGLPQPPGRHPQRSGGCCTTPPNDGLRRRRPSSRPWRFWSNWNASIRRSCRIARSGQDSWQPGEPLPANGPAWTKRRRPSSRAGRSWIASWPRDPKNVEYVTLLAMCHQNVRAGLRRSGAHHRRGGGWHRKRWP